MNEITDILDYYKFTIYKNAKKSIQSKIGLKQINEDEDYIDNFSFETFLNKLSLKIENMKLDKDTFDDVKLIIDGECIKLFKYLQIIICKCNDINNVKILCSDNCCDVCKTNSKLVINVDNFNINDIHPYCKSTLIPIYNKNKVNIANELCTITHLPIEYSSMVNKLLLKLKIYFKNVVTTKEFEILDDIDSIKILDNKIQIPIKLLATIDLERFLIRCLIKDKILETTNIEQWNSLYKIKKDSKNTGDNCIIYSLPFITNQAQLSCENYIVENATQYIINKNDLQIVDKSAYDILDNIFQK